MQSVGERMRNTFHSQKDSNRHSQWKDCLRRYGGIATSYLDNYLRWYQRLALDTA